MFVVIIDRISSLKGSSNMIFHCIMFRNTVSKSSEDRSSVYGKLQLATCSFLCMTSIVLCVNSLTLLWGRFILVCKVFAYRTHCIQVYIIV